MKNIYLPTEIYQPIPGRRMIFGERVAGERLYHLNHDGSVRGDKIQHSYSRNGISIKCDWINIQARKLLSKIRNTNPNVDALDGVLIGTPTAELWNPDLEYHIFDIIGGGMDKESRINLLCESMLGSQRRVWNLLT